MLFFSFYNNFYILFFVLLLADIKTKIIIIILFIIFTFYLNGRDKQKTELNCTFLFICVTSANSMLQTFFYIFYNEIFTLLDGFFFLLFFIVKNISLFVSWEIEFGSSGLGVILNFELKLINWRWVQRLGLRVYWSTGA